ncbi:NUDIX hydrolase [Sedimentisphaera salicampi]|uniref:NUDIX hydrolase n=1 Tax=Sedimentisphaera salicampi TaxID=1941349 RepID=UPI000B9C2F66|nr:NUDIX hydrolase N-terminal domain-containing protein [Sedimentisphaera salicampi]OXU15523.1 NUDIX domain protein [Sedimentisphaera salicampi]
MNWLEIVKELKTISQAGKKFAEDNYELQRHKDIERIAAQIGSEFTGNTTEQILDMFQSDTGYPTPKVDSRGVIIEDDKVLLVKEIEDGGWTLPGGWCENGMKPSENVVREVWEESGYQTRAEQLLAVFDRDSQGHFPPYPFNIYKLFFRCRIVGGKPEASEETSDVAWFSKDQIPPLSSQRTTEKQLKLFFDMAGSQEPGTYFD